MRAFHCNAQRVGGAADRGLIAADRSINGNESAFESWAALGADARAIGRAPIFEPDNSHRWDSLYPPKNIPIVDRSSL